MPPKEQTGRRQRRKSARCCHSFWRFGKCFCLLGRSFYGLRPSFYVGGCCGSSLRRCFYLLGRCGSSERWCFCLGRCCGSSLGWCFYSLRQCFYSRRGCFCFVFCCGNRKSRRKNRFCKFENRDFLRKWPVFRRFDLFCLLSIIPLVGRPDRHKNGDRCCGRRRSPLYP